MQSDYMYLDYSWVGSVFTSGSCKTMSSFEYSSLITKQKETVYK